MEKLRVHSNYGGIFVGYVALIIGVISLCLGCVNYYDIDVVQNIKKVRTILCNSNCRGDVKVFEPICDSSNEPIKDENEGETGDKPIVNILS